MKMCNLIGVFIECCMFIAHIRSSFGLKSLFLVFSIFFLFNLEVKSQYSFPDENVEAPFSYDATPMFVLVQGYKNFYVDAIYANDELLYVNIAELFKSLSIPCVAGQTGDSYSGFIENETRSYIIDYSKKQIMLREKTINVSNGLLKEKGILYLESSLFKDAFGLDLAFNFRALTIILKSNFELPVIKQLRIEQLRNNIKKIKGEQEADTVLKRKYHLFRGGMLDWSLSSYQKWNEVTDNRVGFGVGSELLFGEANVSMNYSSQQQFDNRQLQYLWRWVDNDKLIIKQAQVGKISNQMISFVNAPMIGAVVRNTPTTIRKATGYYTISEKTEPNWTVELYINNTIVDYTKADASGAFVFKVPIVYGYTKLMLKFFGPLGEERTEERSMNMPYSIMPSHEFEYGLSGGVLQDSISSRFGRGEFNYGVNNFLTVGGGLEYLSSIPTGAFIPFAKATFQPYSKLIVNGEYAHGVKSRGVLDFYFLKEALLEIDYAKFVEGQLATRLNANEERKIKLSLPFKYKKIIGFSKFEHNQFVYDSFNYNHSTAMLSAYYKQFSANSITELNWIENNSQYITSILSLSYRLGRGYTIRPSAQYNVSGAKLMTCKLSIEKGIPRGYFTASYERYMLYNDHFLSVSFRYDLSFARVAVSAARSKFNTYTSQSARGSFAFGSGNQYVHVSNNTSVGRGGISIYPFFDSNGNGIFDKGESMVKLSSVKIMGSKAIFSEQDSIIRIVDLNPFTKYILEFNNYDLENVSWRFKNKTYEVLIDPNQFKRIDIPIYSVGEVNGMAYMNIDNSLKGIERVLVKFYQKNSSEVVSTTLSETDGNIYSIGFEPGDYIARLDSVQLSNLNLTVEPKEIHFTINPADEGDVVKGVDFVLFDKKDVDVAIGDSVNQANITRIEYSLKNSKQDSTDVLVVDSQLDTVKDSAKTITKIYADSISKPNVVPPIAKKNKSVLAWGELCDPIGHYYIQCGAFKDMRNALRMGLYIKKHTDMIVGIALHNGLYKVRAICAPSRLDAVALKKILKSKNVSQDLFIVIRK